MQRYPIFARRALPPSPIADARQTVIGGAQGVSLSCRVLGEGHERIVVLTSGIGCGPVFMNRVATELARDHKVVYWDYRGHGESDPAPSGCGYRIEDHAADLDHVVRAFSPATLPLMVSFSMGVQVCVEWTRMNPRRAVAHVFMLGMPRNPMYRTVLLRKPAAAIAETVAMGARPLLSLIQPATRLALRTPFTYVLARSLGIVREGCPMNEFADFVRYATAVPLDAYLRCCAGVLEHDATDAFMRIEEPVLMLAGEHDRLINCDECRALAARLPNATFETLSSASHAGSIEYGTYVTSRIRAFLNSRVPHVACTAA